MDFFAKKQRFLLIFANFADFVFGMILTKEDEKC